MPTDPAPQSAPLDERAYPPGWEVGALDAIAAIATPEAWGDFIVANRWRLGQLCMTDRPKWKALTDALALRGGEVFPPLTAHTAATIMRDQTYSAINDVVDDVFSGIADAIARKPA